MLNENDYKAAKSLEARIGDLKSLRKTFSNNTIRSEIGVVGYSENINGATLHEREKEQRVFKQLMGSLQADLQIMAPARIDTEIAKLEKEFAGYVKT